jgi:two-component system NtrC family response regulator
VVLTRDDWINQGDLPLTLEAPEGPNEAQTQLTAAVEGLERRMIKEALSRAGGIQTRAAESLGITERALRYKLKKYGLQGEDSDAATPQEQ